MENIEKSSREKRFMQFMFKPTYACNLACRYCHIHKMRETASKPITLFQADQLFQWIAGYARRHKVNTVDILWHGGEPLLIPSDDMCRIIMMYTDIFAQNGIKCTSSIQSNLLLLDPKKVGIIKRYFNATIGFSYDYHSSERCFPNGTNASKQIWDKALWAKEQGLNVGCITQITEDNVDEVENVYEHFRNNGIGFKFSRLRNTDKYISALSDEAYIESVKRLFDLWINDIPQKITISNFVEYIRMLIGVRSSSCCYQPQCNVLSFAGNGEITFCDRTDISNYLGNYLTDSFSMIDSRITTLRLRTRLEHNSKCKQCHYFSICNGGCPMNRLSGWDHHECSYTKSILQYISAYLLDHNYELYSKERIS